MKTVSIISCAREPSYLYQTLSGFREPNTQVELVFQGQESDDMLELVLGKKPEPGDALYDTIAALCFNYVCEIPRVYRTEKLFGNVQLNGQYNYAAALMHTHDGLILEDDVRVSEKFMGFLGEVEKLIPDENSIVALYSVDNWKCSDKIELAKYPASNFRNTQAMLYPVHIARQFGQYLLSTLGSKPYDMSLRTFCIERNINLFATNYSLVQHMGYQTTGLGYHHRTRNFVDDCLL